MDRLNEIERKILLYSVIKKIKASEIFKELGEKDFKKKAEREIKEDIEEIRVFLKKPEKYYSKFELLEKGK